MVRATSRRNTERLCLKLLRERKYTDLARRKRGNKGDLVNSSAGRKRGNNLVNRDSNTSGAYDVSALRY